MISMKPAGLLTQYWQRDILPKAIFENVIISFTAGIHTNAYLINNSTVDASPLPKLQDKIRKFIIGDKQTFE